MATARIQAILAREAATAEGMTNLVALGVKTVVGARPLPARCGLHGHDIRKAAKELKTSKWQWELLQWHFRLYARPA